MIDEKEVDRRVESWIVARDGERVEIPDRDGSMIWVEIVVIERNADPSKSKFRLKKVDGPN